MPESSTLYDNADSFGWFSIILHWTSTIAVVVLWYFGNSIESQSVELMADRRSLHVTLGLILWIPLAVRIGWRFMVRHPHVKGQTDTIHQLAKLTHYLMLIALIVMLTTGPIMAFLLAEGSTAQDIARWCHSTSALVLLLLVLLHVLGALKHLMFHEDEKQAHKSAVCKFGLLEIKGYVLG